MTPSTTHLVLLPSYNTGPRLRSVVEEALRHWQPVLVVIDGSTDGSERTLRELARAEPNLLIVILERNVGKGAAVLEGSRLAQEKGFTHVLVMDADGQHPAASIGEFMEASVGRPEAMILGRPIFPANVPPARLHGRKLSVGMVRLELLGAAVDDPLFGFRVYPLAPLREILGDRRGGRRYDFDTEAAVRLAWAGVLPVNLAAPVRYFSAAEGGVSHFHYLRDNLTLIGMHIRLVTELLFCRWPALLGHRRRWRSVGLLAALLLVCLLPAAAVPSDSLENPENRVSLQAPEWKDLAETFAHRPDTLAGFSERRFFPFKKEAVELKGDVRVSASRGLSLHYRQPEERIVILDGQGVLIRAPDGAKAPPADPRAAAANQALLHVLRLDFSALEKDFELYGRREGAAWELLLVARTDALRRSVGRIAVDGTGPAVNRIEIRRSARQAILITMEAPQPNPPFTEEELRRFFR